MTSTSKYIQLNDFLLLEYYYKNEEHSTQIAKAQRITNHITNTYQFVNDSAAVGVTGNVLDNSASIIDSSINKWASHDTDNGNLIGTPSFTLEEISTIPDIKYDRIRIHILTGYSFDDTDGFIFDIGFTENSGKLPNNHNIHTETENLRFDSNSG
jgi:hypothetical protein